MRRRCLVLLLLGLVLAPMGAGALELGAIGSLSGSYKNLFFRTEDSLNHVVSTDLNRLRLTLQGARKPLAWELVYDQELLVGDLVHSSDFETLQALRDPTFLDLEDTIRQGSRYEWRHLVYRAALRWEHPYGHVIAGRQRIAWGSGRLWNPTDFFNPVLPTALEPDEKVGVDALFLAFTHGPFGALHLVGAPGREERQVSSKGAVRWRDTVGETDYALMLGAIDTSVLMGLDLTTNLFNGGLRFEVLLSDLQNGQPEARVVVGYDYRLTNDWLPSGLYLLAEYFFNSETTDLISPFDIGEELGTIPGGALPDIPEGSIRTPRRTQNLIQTRAHHQLGLSANYDLTPLWNLAGIFIVALDDSSYFFAPSLTWSVVSNIDLTATVQLFDGSANSQYGDNADLFFVQVEVYF